MTSNKKLFQLAQLAEASYANFTNFNSSTAPSVIETALKEAGLSTTQSEEFAENWRVVNYQPNTATGYSGTFFQYIGNDPNSGFTNGELVFSQRGTKGGQDIFETDIGEIAVNGLAYSQIVDMYNYWQRLTAAEGAEGGWGLAAC